MKAWRKRIGAIVVALGVLAGIVVVAPSPAMAAAKYASCGMGSSARTGVVSADPTYHDIYWGVYTELGAVQWWVREYPSNVTISTGWNRTDSTKSIGGHITGLYGQYYLAMDCHGGYSRGYIS